MTNLTQPAAGVSPQRDFDFSALLNSLDGLSYVVAADGTILAVGEPAWSDFAVANDAPAIHGSLIVGRDLFDGTTDDNVRALQRRLHQAVLDRHSPVIAYDYRCDAPHMVRRMRMAMTPLRSADSVAVLYHSVVLEEYPRPRMSLFDKHQNDGETEMPTVTMCSYCHDVAWPIGAPADTRAWIEPEAYYQRGGPSQVMVSHGICPDCYDRLTSKLA